MVAVGEVAVGEVAVGEVAVGDLAVGDLAVKAAGPRNGASTKRCCSSQSAALDVPKPWSGF